MSEFSDEVASLLPTLLDNRESQEQLTKLIVGLDDRLIWEAGPYQGDLAYLAFSPNFDPELLPLTQSLTSKMPAVVGWIFFDAKPRKSWTSRSVEYLGKKYSFDDWSYRLTSFKGGEFFDIDFFGCDADVSEEIRDWLALFLASSELGERLFMTAVDRVSASPRDDRAGPTVAIEHLYQQITSLLVHPVPL